MSKTFNEYAADRNARLSREGRVALQVFDAAESLAATLRQARAASGLTQTALSELAGVTQSDISRIERGLLAPTTTTLLRLVRAMGGELQIVLPA